MSMTVEPRRSGMVPDTSPHYRLASPADAVALAELGAATFSETFGHLYRPEDLQHFLASERSSAAFERHLNDPAARITLATSGSQAIGYALTGPCRLPVPRLESRAGEIQQLYLRQPHQGAGLGSRLLGMALDELAARGFEPVYVGVWSLNEGAQRLYARFGFAKVGEYDFPVGDQLDREFILRQDRAPGYR